MTYTYFAREVEQIALLHMKAQSQIRGFNCDITGGYIKMMGTGRANRWEYMFSNDHKYIRVEASPSFRSFKAVSESSIKIIRGMDRLFDYIQEALT